MKLYAEHIRINKHGYDNKGRYWGIGEKLYHVFSLVNFANQSSWYVRAPTARDAKAEVLAKGRSELPRITEPSDNEKAGVYSL